MYWNRKSSILLNTRDFFKGRKEVFIVFEENIFPLPKPCVFGKKEWKERRLGKEEFIPNILKNSFLSKLGPVSLSQKENGLLNTNFGFENIDNTETKE